MLTADFTTGAATFVTIGANSITTERSFDATFGMALRLLQSLMKEPKSAVIGEICVMIDENTASVGGGEGKLRLISREVS